MSALVYEIREGRASRDGRQLRDWVDDITALIVERFAPRKVILDDAPANRRRELMVALRQATRSVDVPRDLLVTSTADFENNRSVVGTTEYEPANRGVVVYERQPAAWPTRRPRR